MAVLLGQAKCKLHPLIYTIASESSAHNVEKKKAEQKTPHFLSPNQDIVVCAQEVKCELKYVMFTQDTKPTELFAPSDCSGWLCNFLLTGSVASITFCRFTTCRGRL